MVYASVTPAARGSGGQIDRIDVRSGRAVPLPLRSWLGVDGAGTAYGATRDKDGATRIVRCRRRADACDSVPFPAFQTPPGLNPLLVDPNAAGVLVAFNRVLNSPLGWVARGQQRQRRDLDAGGGHDVLQRALRRPGRAHPLLPFSRRALGLPGRGPQLGDHASCHRRARSSSGARPAATFGGAPADPITFPGEGGRTVSPPISGQLIVDPTDADRLFVVRR